MAPMWSHTYGRSSAWRRIMAMRLPAGSAVLRLRCSQRLVQTIICPHSSPTPILLGEPQEHNRQLEALENVVENLDAPARRGPGQGRRSHANSGYVTFVKLSLGRARVF